MRKDGLEQEGASPEEVGKEGDDGWLVEKMKGGEGWALGVLWKRYAALLYTQAARILHNPAETEDVVVEVFEEAWKRVENYRPERARPVAWLLTLVRRRAIDRLRQRRSSQRAEERLQEDGAGEEEGRCLVDEQVRLRDLRGLLDLALRDLPVEQRMTVCLAYYEGCTQREIARRTCAPMGTVKSRLEMALRKLREALCRRQAGYPCEQTWIPAGKAREPFWKKTFAVWGAVPKPASGKGRMASQVASQQAGAGPLAPDLGDGEGKRQPERRWGSGLENATDTG